MVKRLNIQNETTATLKGRVSTTSRELPARIEKLMKSDAYWNKRNPDHQEVKEAVNGYFKSATPPPEQVSLVTAAINGRVVQQTRFIPAQDPRFSNTNGTTPEDISKPFQGGN